MPNIESLRAASTAPESPHLLAQLPPGAAAGTYQRSCPTQAANFLLLGRPATPFGPVLCPPANPKRPTFRPPVFCFLAALPDTKSRHDPTRSSRVFSHFFSCLACALAASRSSLYSALARVSSSSICGGGEERYTQQMGALGSGHAPAASRSGIAKHPLGTAAQIKQAVLPTKPCHHQARSHGSQATASHRQAGSAAAERTRLVSFRRRHSARASTSRALSLQASWNSSVCGLEQWQDEEELAG